MGLPQPAMRFASLNMGRREKCTEEQTVLLRQMNPDILFLQEARGRSLPDLKMLIGTHLVATAWFPLQNLPDADNDIGVAILSKFPLADARPIPNHMKGACGVWGICKVEERSFYVACLRPSDSSDRTAELEHFVKAWSSLGRPPIVASIEPLGADEIIGLQSQAEDPIWRFAPLWPITSAHVKAGIHFVETRR